LVREGIFLAKISREDRCVRGRGARRAMGPQGRGASRELAGLAGWSMHPA